ncbi:hypothetical protein BN4901_1747 [Citrobacter europaeus]|uniref:Uncharacterized protein n=1 Tax=Citrobacter europaeus TaxID=1914243 RepID=A0ABY0JNL4_9ENTR|nr:hypothetical protein CIP106467_1855 [Citrobacter europaeus]SBW24448.1 hypothetical protein BN4901_1747 [Citrobacter europaeus]
MSIGISEQNFSNNTAEWSLIIKIPNLNVSVFLCHFWLENNVISG